MSRVLTKYLVFGIIGGILGYGLYYLKACTGMT